MKRILFALMMLLTCGMIQAQDWDFGGRKGGGSYETKKNSLGVEVSAGGTGEFAVSVGARWQMNLSENFAWDVVSVKVLAEPDYFSDSITPMLMTGIRAYSPEFAGMRVYANARAGYDYNFSGEVGGVCFEVGAGLQVTRNISVGYSYNSIKFSEDGYSATAGMHGVTLGFTF